MPRRRLVIVGAGGFAREVRWLAREIDACTPSFDFVGYVVSDLTRLGAHDSQSEVLGDYDWLREHRGDVDVLALGIGTPAARLKVASELAGDFPAESWPSLVHPNVRLDATTCELGHGTIICAGTILTVGVRVHPYAMVNLACTLGHEAELGSGSVLNPTVNLSGGVQLGEQVLVGTGAQILQYVRVGAGATVGAGAVVVKDVEPGTTVVGVPAAPLRGK